MMQIFKKPTPFTSKKEIAAVATLLFLAPAFSQQQESAQQIVIETAVPEDLGLEDVVIDKTGPEATPVTLTPETTEPPSADEVVEEEDIVSAEPEKAPDTKEPESTETLEDQQSQPTETVKPEEPPVPDTRNGYQHVDIDLPGIEKELTQRYIKYYQGKEGREILVLALKNSVPYRPYVIESLKKNNLPLYLQYIPVIESNYKPTAVSRSGATGIWQFMENSMAPLMKKSKWFDDRRDPWLSTDAAMLKFKDNYRFFNDWSLAMAAYNCGAGSMQKILKANPGSDFWALAEKGLLKAEPTHYVPKLLAVAEIVENAGYYGLEDVKKAADLIKDKTPDEFEYVTTKAMISFKQISEVTGLPVDKIKQLNQALLKEGTPLGETYKLRLPKGYSNGIEEKLRKKGLATDCVIHKVEKGDTLWGISRKYGVTVSELCLANGINENSVLSIGKELIVPIFK